MSSNPSDNNFQLPRTYEYLSCLDIFYDLRIQAFIDIVSMIEEQSFNGTFEDGDTYCIDQMEEIIDEINFEWVKISKRHSKYNSLLSDTLRFEFKRLARAIKLMGTSDLIPWKNGDGIATGDLNKIVDKWLDTMVPVKELLDNLFSERYTRVGEQNDSEGNDEIEGSAKGEADPPEESPCADPANNPGEISDPLARLPWVGMNISDGLRGCLIAYLAGDPGYQIPEGGPYEESPSALAYRVSELIKKAMPKGYSPPNDRWPAKGPPDSPFKVTFNASLKEKKPGRKPHKK